MELLPLGEQWGMLEVGVEQVKFRERLADESICRGHEFISS